MFKRGILILIVLISMVGCAHQSGHIYPVNSSWFIRSEMAPWGVLIPLAGLKQVSHKISNDEKYIYTHLATGNLNLSIWMEPVDPKCSTVECIVKNKLEKDATIKGSEYVKTYQVGKFNVLEYYLKKWPAGMPPVEGLKAGDEFKQLNMTALFFRDGYWSEIHLSHPITEKISVETMQNSFKQILQGTKIIDQKI